MVEEGLNSPGRTLRDPWGGIGGWGGTEEAYLGTVGVGGSQMVPTLREKKRAGIASKMKKKKEMMERNK